MILSLHIRRRVRLDSGIDPPVDTNLLSTLIFKDEILHSENDFNLETPRRTPEKYLAINRLGSRNPRRSLLALL